MIIWTISLVVCYVQSQSIHLYRENFDIFGGVFHSFAEIAELLLSYDQQNTYFSHICLVTYFSSALFCV